MTVLASVRLWLRRSRREAAAFAPPLRREGLTRRLVPLLLAAVITVLIRVGPSVESVSRAQLASLVMVGFLPITAYLLPWNRLPLWTQALPPLVSIPLYLLILLGTPETQLPYSPVLLLPLIFLGLYYAAAELAIGIVLMLLVSVAPAFLSAAPLGDWVLASAYASVTAVAAISVHLVTRSIRRHDADATNLATLLRDAAMAQSPAGARLAVCHAAWRATDAREVMLVEARGDELLVTATWPERPGAAQPLSPASAHAAQRALVSGQDAQFLRASEGGPSDLPPGAKSAFYWPLTQGDEATAVLVATFDWVVGSRARRESGGLRLLAPEAALVISHADTVERLGQLALIDSLTNLPNRVVWERELPRQLAQSARAGEPACVVALDLDYFKAFNDDWGHRTGDDLLRTVAQGWRGALREVDLVARLGGDEFGAILPNCSLSAAQLVIERLRDVMPEGQTFSAGIAWWNGEESGAEVLARADALLYEGKRGGRGQVVTSRPGTGDGSLTEWTSVIPRLIEAQEIVSVYQPICSLDDRTILGYEALARPAGQAADLSVEAMFAAAQRMGAHRDLDWLARRAAFAGAANLPRATLLFVNVGARALLDPLHDVDQMILLAQWANRAESSIVLEISEREVISDLRRFTAVLETYRRAGFQFAMDDVGEGHLTLEMMGAGNPEYVKIARSLTVESSMGSQRSLVRALVEFAVSSGAHLIAEGIETPEQLEAMRNLGVDMGQGYLLGRPMALADAARPTLVSPGG